MFETTYGGGGVREKIYVWHWDLGSHLSTFQIKHCDSPVSYDTF